jgi:hypothetical protein
VPHDSTPGLEPPRELPRYPVGRRRDYLQISAIPLRSWVPRRPNPVDGGSRYSKPLIAKPDPQDPRLSSTTSLSHVLRALRTRHNVSMSTIRSELDYAENEFVIGHEDAPTRGRI